MPEQNQDESFRVLSDDEFARLTLEQRTEYVKQAVKAVSRLVRQLKSVVDERD